MSDHAEEAVHYLKHDDPRNGLQDFAVAHAILALTEEVKTLRMIVAEHLGYANGGEPTPRADGCPVCGASGDTPCSDGDIDGVRQPRDPHPPRGITARADQE